MAATTHYKLSATEGVDALLAPTTSLAGATTDTAVLKSRCAEGVGHGLYPGNPSWSFQQFEDRMYGTNGKGYPFVFDGQTTVRAGLETPVSELDYAVEKRSLRTPEQGAAYVGPGTFVRGATGVLTIATGWTFTDADIGRLVVIPSHPDMAGNDGPDYIGIISAINSGTQAQTLPRPTTNQDAGANNLAVSIFDTKADDPTSATGWISALAKLKDSTTAATTRLQVGGADGGATTFQVYNPAQQAEDTDGQKVLDLRGNHNVEIVDLSTEEVGADVVLDFKAYLRFSDLTTGNSAMVLWEKRDDPETASWELAIVENGKLRFRFWDTAEEAWRSATTIGRCFSVDEWYFVRFRYKYKRAGGSTLDTVGGLEPDNRYIVRGGGATGAWTGHHFTRNFRDCLTVAAMERKAPADQLLLVPGMHNAWSQNVAAPEALTINHSRSLPNMGLPAEEPWIGPEAGDPGYTSTLGTPPKVSFQATAAGASFPQTFTAPAGMFLPRWFSTNRDEPIDGNGKTQIAQATGGASTGNLTNRAVLAYIYTDGTGATLSPPRVLAVLDVGNTDLGNASRDGAGGSTFTLGNSTAYGADGGAIIAAGGNVEMAFALPNGSNHSANATGNRDPLPTLWVQDPDHPLGVRDTPKTDVATIRLGGPTDAEVRQHGLVPSKVQMGDVGFSLAALDDAAEVYTADMMAPDCDWHGPVDTRIHSLPPLCFRDSATSRNADDVANGDNNCKAPTWSARHKSDDDSTVTVAFTEEGELPHGELNLETTAVQQPGTHQVVVTFYDPERDIESPPSQVSKIEIEDDLEGLASEAKIKLKNLPISASRDRRVWRRIYKTLQDGSIYFRSAEIQDNATKEVLLAPDVTFLVNQPRLDFGYQNPPVCNYLRATESRMVYAALDDAPSAFRWSDGFKPEQVPGSNTEVLESTEGNPVTGMAYLSGQLYVFKRDSVFAVQIAEIAQVDRLQGNTGTVSHWSVAELEDMAMFAAEKGVYAFDGTARLQYVSAKVEQTYRGLRWESRPWSWACYNRDRNQYMLAGSSKATGELDLLLTAEVESGPVVWSRQDLPNGVHALLSADDPYTDDQVIIFGDRLGFVGQLDVDTGSRGHQLGSLYGTSVFTVAGAISGGEISTTGSVVLDVTGSGLVGCPFVVVRPGTIPELIGSGYLTEARDDSGTVKLRPARPQELPTLAADDLLYVGGWERSWTSRHHFFTDMGLKKRLQYIDLVFDAEAGGTFRFDLYHDFGTSPSYSQSIPMDQGWYRIPTEKYAYFLRYRVQRVGTNAPLNLFLVQHRLKEISQR